MEVIEDAVEEAIEEEEAETIMIVGTNNKITSIKKVIFKEEEEDVEAITLQGQWTSPTLNATDVASMVITSQNVEQTWGDKVVRSLTL